MEPVNVSESTIYLIYTVKIFLYSYYCYFFKLDFPCRSKSDKAVSEKLEIFILITSRSSKRDFWIFL